MSIDTNSRARRLVDAQAKDEGLWFQAVTAPESYLQEALRALHAAVEAGQRDAQQALRDVEAEITEATKELTEDVSVLQDICRKLEGREKDLRLALMAIAEEGCEYEGSHPTCNLAPGDYNGCSPCISATALEEENS